MTVRFEKIENTRTSFNENLFYNETRGSRRASRLYSPEPGIVVVEHTEKFLALGGLRIIRPWGDLE